MKFSYEELIDVKRSISTERLNGVSGFQSVTNSIDGLKGNRNLLGNGWVSTVTHLEAYQEIDQALFNIFYEMENSLDGYLTDFVGEVGKTDELLDTDELAELYRELQTAQNDYFNLMNALAESMKDVPVLGAFFKKQSMEPIKDEIEILEKYQRFEGSHGSQYSELARLMTDVNTGLAQLGNPANFISPQVGYRITDFSNQQWYKNLKSYNEERTIDRIEVIQKLEENGEIKYVAYRNGVIDEKLTAEINEESFLDKAIDVLDKFADIVDTTLKIVGGGAAVVTGIVGAIGGAAIVTLATGGYGLVVDGVIVAQGISIAAVGAMYFNEGLDSLGNSPQESEIKNTYNSIKDAPQYPEGFEPAKGQTLKDKINNGPLLDQLRRIESGEWKKIYKNGYDKFGNEISIHYFQSKSGKVFNVKVINKWSYK
ncbi:T7SS effector LXG polymorphic toxin [Enterococcus sp. LJL128]